MMPSTESPAHYYYDPDAVIPQNSPVLVATKVNTRPSPSPEFVIPLRQISPPSFDGRWKAKRPKVQPSQGDAVLISIMGEGRDPSIAARAGQQLLPGSDDDDVASPGSDGLTDEADNTGSMSPVQPPADHYQKPQLPLSPPSDLKMLADNVLAALDLNRASVSDDGGMPPAPVVTTMEAPRVIASPAFSTVRPHAVRHDRPHPVFPVPYSPGSIYTPRTGSFASPTASLGHESLAPIQNASPRSQSDVGVSLPSLKDQFGPEALSPSFAHSPPGTLMFHGMPPRISSMSHASPPISPHELNPRSPHQQIMSPSPFTPWMLNKMPLPQRGSIDYSGSTPSEKSVSTPAASATSTSVADRMSIDGLAFSNAGEQGQYVCNFPDCKAPPFQTQYLLNSHANVHSQSRPHYCPYKGCARGEGGKGFKRKNEMIRHGLVHESPGYVCPYCLDREHRYPRPDNLQRHVRVHHPDKDKDSPELREVLSQRPDGPSRGRRRRGGGG